MTLQPVIFETDPCAKEIIDAVQTHLTQQGHRSMRYDASETQTCAYRGTGGRLCAVGLFIPEDSYEPDMERGDVEFLYWSFHEKLPGWFEDRLELLLDLQKIHDRCYISGTDVFDLEDLNKRLDRLRMVYEHPEEGL